MSNRLSAGWGLLALITVVVLAPVVACLLCCLWTYAAGGAS